MARKFCPSCNRLTGGSATECQQCGHIFDASTIVVAEPPKVCRLCGANNPQIEQTCHCGHHLDINVDECRALLRGRRTNGAILAGLGATAVAAIIVTFFVFEVIWPWMLIGAAAVLAYGVRGIFAANHLIAALPPSLPKATLREPRD